MARPSSIILDDDEPAPRESDFAVRSGFEWGLASTLIGITFFIAAPTGVLVNLWLEKYGAIRASVLLVFVCELGVGMLSALGVRFGLRGLGYVRRTQQPAALAVTGILLCSAATLVWVIAAFQFLAEMVLITRY